MAFEIIMAEISALISRMNEQPQDSQELEVLLREKLNEFRALGLPLPQDLVDLEAALDEGLDREARMQGQPPTASGE